MSLHVNKPDKTDSAKRPKELSKQVSEAIKVPKLKTKEILKIKQEKSKLDAFKTGKQPS